MSAPKQTHVAGLKAIELEVSLAPNWTTTCPFSNGLAAVPLFYSPTTARGWWAAGTEHLLLDFIDVPGKGTVVVDADAYEVANYPALVAQAQAIVKSLAFPAK